MDSSNETDARLAALKAALADRKPVADPAALLAKREARKALRAPKK